MGIDFASTGGLVEYLIITVNLVLDRLAVVNLRNGVAVNLEDFVLSRVLLTIVKRSHANSNAYSFTSCTHRPSSDGKRRKWREITDERLCSCVRGSAGETVEFKRLIKFDAY
jgi:hypothetical protein